MLAYKILHRSCGIEILEKLKKQFKNRQQLNQYKADLSTYPKSFLVEEIILEKDLKNYRVLNPDKL